MKVLIVSHLFDDIASGPSWSVPSYVESLSRIDEVLWVNTIEDTMPHWKEVDSFHRLSEFGKLKLSALYKDGSRPDIAIFQGFNFLEQARFALKIKRKGIPYIIVPRGSLTHDAIHNHAWFKKWIAHKLILDRYVKNAAAIQYLTKEEKAESGNGWNKYDFVLSNGFSNDVVKKQFSQEGIRGVFIGRLDMYHKGIDILIDAVERVSETMRQAHFCIDFYGPEKYDYTRLKDIIASRRLNDILTVNGPVSGKVKSEVLLNADLFVLTSRFEGHPMGLIEALSYGLPAMVTAGSNMMEKIDEHNAGWVADPNDKETIALCIERIIAEKGELAIKGKNARELALEYDWQPLARQLHNELEGIIAREH